MFPHKSDIILHVGYCETTIVFRRDLFLMKMKGDTCLLSDKSDLTTKPGSYETASLTIF